MNKAVLFAIGAIVLAGLSWWWLADEAGFDMDAFVQQVDRLQAAARMARKVSDAKIVPEYLQPEVAYLDELRQMLQGSGDCQTTAEALTAHHQRHLAQHPDLSDEALARQMAQLNSRERRSKGLRLILILAPRWKRLVAPVKQYVQACPKESVVLNGILLGNATGDSR